MLHSRPCMRPASLAPSSCNAVLPGHLNGLGGRSRLVSSPGTVGRVLASVVVRGSKDDLENELELTRMTLEKVLQAAQAAQAAQQQSATSNLMDYTLYNREQQLWDRQQAMLDRLQQQWDQDRQAWLERERLLLSEISQLRHELHQAHLHSAAAATLSSSPAAAAPASSAASSPTPQPASAPSTASSAAAAAVPPAVGLSVGPAAATISGPSPASASVAAAIRAMQDDEGDGPAADNGAWEGLFGGGSSSSSAADSIGAAIAAVDTSDVLSNLDLSFSSGGRGRRRVDLTPAPAASSSSSSSNGSSILDEVATSSSSSVNAAPAAAAVAAAAETLVEVAKGDPEGPPPLLSVGDDDIFWISKLHAGLMGAGFYPSDEEVENWLFAEGTQSALLTFQACNDIPETGTADEDTWRRLLGEEYQALYGHLTPSSSSSSSSSTNGSGLDTPGAAAAVAASDVSSFEPQGSSSSSSSSSAWRSTGWPVVMETDGGREVHALQVSLCKAGFHCGDDELRWWQFGSSTLDALRTFQACNGLPESGVCDECTWRALLGSEATPDLLDEVRGDESSYEDDMSAAHDGAVWLLGEQRWSRPGCN